jgi:hypothetical protein
MPLARKAGSGLCRDTVQKKLLRIQSGWYTLSLLSGAYCAKATVSQVKNNQSDFSGMQTYNWNLFWPLGTGAWVSTGAVTATPLYGIGRGRAITYQYPWINECLQIHSANQYQFSISSGTISGVRLYLESPGETERDFLRTSGDILYSDVSYALDPPSIGGALNIRLASSIQAPRFAWDGADISLSIDTLSDNSAAVVGVEPWQPFSNAGLSRFSAGGWAYYDLPAAMVTWINTNRTFFMHTNWTTGYAPWFYLDGYSNYTYTRTIRGMAFQVYCEF